MVEHARHPTTSGVRIAAATLGMGGGIAVRLSALQTLGRFFLSDIAVARDQPLVQTGVFAWVRHPSELGLMLTTAGAVFLLGSWVGALLCAVGIIPASLIRIRQEDAFLRNVFGSRFHSYANRVPALIPALRRRG